MVADLARPLPQAGQRCPARNQSGKPAIFPPHSPHSEWNLVWVFMAFSSLRESAFRLLPSPASGRGPPSPSSRSSTCSMAGNIRSRCIPGRKEDGTEAGGPGCNPRQCSARPSHERVDAEVPVAVGHHRVQFLPRLDWSLRRARSNSGRPISFLRLARGVTLLILQPQVRVPLVEERPVLPLVAAPAHLGDDGMDVQVPSGSSAPCTPGFGEWNPVSLKKTGNPKAILRIRVGGGRSRNSGTRSVMPIR